MTAAASAASVEAAAAAHTVCQQQRLLFGLQQPAGDMRRQGVVSCSQGAVFETAQPAAVMWCMSVAYVQFPTVVREVS